MNAKSTDVVFLSAVRTPFGTFGGKLKDISPIDLAVHASKHAIERGGIAATDIDQTIFGNVLYTTRDSIYFARHGRRQRKAGQDAGTSFLQSGSAYEAGGSRSHHHHQ